MCMRMDPCGRMCVYLHAHAFTILTCISHFFGLFLLVLLQVEDYYSKSADC